MIAEERYWWIFLVILYFSSDLFNIKIRQISYIKIDYLHNYNISLHVFYLNHENAVVERQEMLLERL